MVDQKLRNRQLTELELTDLQKYLREPPEVRLAHWLNAAQYSRGGRKIGDLVDDVNRYAQDPKDAKLYQRIERQAKRYKATLSLDQALEPREAIGRWHLMWELPIRPGIKTKWPHGAAHTPVGRILSQIVWLSQGGLLDRLRHCASCAKWFFARKRDQHFCLAACRQKHYESDPAVKQRRRERMRKYMRSYRA